MKWIKRHLVVHHLTLNPKNKMLHHLIKYLNDDSISVLEIEEEFIAVSEWKPIDRERAFNEVLGIPLNPFIKKHNIADSLVWNKSLEKLLDDYLEDFPKLKTQYSSHFKWKMYY